MPPDDVEREPEGVQKKRGTSAISMGAEDKGVERATDRDIRMNAAPNQRTLVNNVVCHI
jgi:hypothetical protein